MRTTVLMTALAALALTSISPARAMSGTERDPGSARSSAVYSGSTSEPHLGPFDFVQRVALSAKVFYTTSSFLW